MLRDLFRKSRVRKPNEGNPELEPEISPVHEEREKRMEGLWVRCDKCQEIFLAKELDKNFRVCSKCGHHFRVPAVQRIDMLLDKGSFVEWDRDLVTRDPLQFPGYMGKVAKCQQETGLAEAILTGEGRLEGAPLVVGVMDARFIMASMGTVVGEKIVRAIEGACARRIPLVLFSASGGARMQEGVLSLMQMARTSAALTRLSAVAVPFISILTDPTTGGVTASFAMLGDVILAEPGALVGFTGPRVIEQTIRQKLPAGFQRAEFLQQHGMIDQIIPRPQLRTRLALLLALHSSNTEGVTTDAPTA